MHRSIVLHAALLWGAPAVVVALAGVLVFRPDLVPWARVALPAACGAADY